MTHYTDHVKYTYIFKNWPSYVRKYIINREFDIPVKNI